MRQAAQRFSTLGFTMRRTAVLLIMLFAMLWQSVALGRIGSTVNAWADPAHAALHLQDKSHHHHDDGSFHLDNSIESAQHVATDHLSPTLAMSPPSSHALPPVGSFAHRSLHDSVAPNPTLDGLLRPPRSRS